MDRQLRLGPPLIIAVGLWVAVGCKPSGEGSIDPVSLLDLGALPVWEATVDLTIGDSWQEGEGFIDPTPLGADESGRIYVFDAWLREVRRFDQRGVFESLLVGPGDGPREMRLRPMTFGMASGLIWWWETQTGRIQYYPVLGGEPYSEDTDLTYLSFGTLNLLVSPVKPGGPYWVEAAVLDSLDTSLRPRHRVEHLFIENGSSQVVEWYWANRGLRFDGGQTHVRYSGPSDEPFGVGIGRRLLRVDRLRGSEEDGTPIRVRLLSETGALIRAVELWLPPRYLTEGDRASMESEIVHGARLGGARTLASATQSRISDFVAAVPERLPAVGQVANGPDDSVWLEIQGETARWLVLDSLFEPRAVAAVPPNVLSMEHRQDGSWWAKLKGANDVRYVGRLTFAKSPS